MGSATDLVDSMGNFVNRIVDEKLKNEVRTAIPGHILSFDPDAQMAQVQIGIKRLTIAGESIDPPPIIRCPVYVYGATGGAIEVEIASGDECLVQFSMRCIDGWRNQGGVAPLVSTERFRESDAFALVGIRSLPNVLASYENNGIRIRSKSGDAHVWIKNDSSIEISSPGDITINGATITASGDVRTASGISLNDHVHGYTDDGSPLISDPPQ